MRLITHNMLQCHVKGCNANNFPLELQEVVLEQEEAEMNEDFLRNMLTKIEYDALVATCLKVRLLLHSPKKKRYGKIECRMVYIRRRRDQSNN